MDMSKIIGAVISIAVAIILIGTFLAPTVSEMTASGGALEQYKSLISAVIILTIVVVLMVAVRLVTSRE